MTKEFNRAVPMKISQHGYCEVAQKARGHDSLTACLHEYLKVWPKPSSLQSSKFTTA